MICIGKFNFSNTIIQSMKILYTSVFLNVTANFKITNFCYTYININCIHFVRQIIIALFRKKYSYFLIYLI